MAILALLFGLAAVIWGAWYAWRGSLAGGCALVLIVGYILGYEFWNTHIGPLPLTLDRLILLGLLAAGLVRWRLGILPLRPMTTGDWSLVLLLVIVTGSALASGQPDEALGATSKWGRLLTAFFIPTALFVAMRQIPFRRPDWLMLLSGMVLLGVYLAATGVLEVAGKWALVFPRYIADPNLGTHFGRARGPELNSVSLGMYLTASFWCAWTLMLVVQQRWQQFLLLVTMPLMLGCLYLTYTRSTWLGLVVSGAIVGAAAIPRRWRLPTLGAASIAATLLVALSWSQLTGLQREGSATDSSHSVDQRTSFAYVSWQMFRDHPVFGVGFGRFFDRKLPYLSDRSQAFELESIRPLHHHNTLLSTLTETGMVGLAAFAMVLIVWSRIGWRLAMDADLPAWMRAQGVLMLALMTNYLTSALFHDLTLIPSQPLLLFAFAGLSINLRQQAASSLLVPGSARVQRMGGSRAIALPQGSVLRQCSSPPAVDNPTAATPAHVDLFGMRIARVTMAESVDRLLQWCVEPRAGSCRYVVTPNVDHAVLFQRQADVRAAYREASLVLADGAPIVWASRLCGRGLPERVAGSDLVPQLFASARSPLKVFLLGAAPGVAETAAAQIKRQWPNARIVGTYSPPMGFEHDAAENSRILSAIAAVTPDLLIVGLGAPKQEMWVYRHHAMLQAKVALCVGATIDFLAGERRRSPVWMRRVGLEWLHRMGSEPRRLIGRYARDAWVFPRLVWREWRQRCA